MIQPPKFDYRKFIRRRRGLQVFDVGAGAGEGDSFSALFKWFFDTGAPTKEEDPKY